MIQDYIKKLNENLEDGDTTEHTHRSTLEALVKSFDKNLHVTNEPKRRTDVGAPDIIVRKLIANGQRLPLGYIETKDIGQDLNKWEKDEQLLRYLKLPNLILTDYLEFRWYVRGEKRQTVTLGTVSRKKIKLDPDGAEKLTELFTSFLTQEVANINSPKELAARLAGLCRNIDRIISETFAAGEASDLMQDLKSAFERTLLPDITAAQFADMFAQTLGYGLFAARIHHEETKPNEEFIRTGAAREIPKSNPFLRNLFDTIHSADLEEEAFIGFVDDLTAVLAHTDIGAVLAQFGKRTKQEDPILHFYETFLSEYDPKERKRRGVYYTPEPVVSYIVRSVDILLKEKFGLPDGLADTTTIEVEVKEGETYVKKTLPKVLILDPACGTGTFLYAVIDLIRNRFMDQKRAGEWRSFVHDHLIPRIYGFELQMAPYAVAHLKLAMQLAGHDLTDAQRKKWGYEFGKDERLNVYLTNSLEYTEEKIQMEFGFIERAIADEARAAQAIKGELPIMVVMGNPPYANYGKMNKGEWIQNQIQVYKEGLKERKLNLDDDFVKFIRFGQWRIEQTGHGILAFITNNIYVDGVTHWKMRRSLCDTFPEIYVVDLHGNTRRKERAPDGSLDENVFDIMQGVAIGLFIRPPIATSSAIVHHSELWGSRDAKYGLLSSNSIANTKWWTSGPINKSPAKERDCAFAPTANSESSEYVHDASIIDIFPEGVSGIESKRDHFAYEFDRNNLEERVASFIRSEGDIDEIKLRFMLQDNDWSVEDALKAIKRDKHWRSRIRECLYRPFDTRWLIYSNDILARTRGPIMASMIDTRNYLRPLQSSDTALKSNLAMVVGRQGQVVDSAWNLVFCSRLMTDRNLFYRGGHRHMPLFFADRKQVTVEGEIIGRNLSAKFVAEFAGKLGLEFVEEGAPYLKALPPVEPPPRRVVASSAKKTVSGGKKKTPPNPPKPSLEGNRGSAAISQHRTFGPEDVFYYIYAVFHSPTYRERYKEFLKIDFPRVPLTANRELFGKLVALGHELTAYHLLEHATLNDAPVRFPEPGSNQVEKVRYDEQKGRVFINAEQYFETVPPEVWEFHVGGYQVCQKWLKDRKGRPLSYDEQKHYEKVVMALGETIRLMKEIDEAIPEWPIT